MLLCVWINIAEFLNIAVTIDKIVPFDYSEGGQSASQQNLSWEIYAISAYTCNLNLILKSVKDIMVCNEICKGGTELLSKRSYLADLATLNKVYFMRALPELFW